jgi:hypothetical protein
MPRQEIDVQHRAVGEVVDLVEAGDVGHGGAAADIDEDLVGAEHLRPDRDLVRRHEARLALVDGAVLELLHRSLDALAGAAGDGVLARLDLLHVDRDLAADGEAVVRAAPGHVHGIGAGDQRLGGRAAGVDAGAAETAALDDRHLHAGSGQPPRERRACLARSNDDGVVHGHDALPRDAMTPKIKRSISILAVSSDADLTGRPTY